MALYNVARVNSLPASESLQPNTFYFVKGESNDQFFSLYTTGNDASTVRHLPTKSEITTWISEFAANFSLESVADINARDALVPSLTGNKLVLVGDASADPTVNSGAAFYFYKHEEGTWQKISEVESMDLTLSWAGLQDKPNSDVSDIDDAVTKRHEHTNKTLLDSLALNEHKNLTYQYQDDLGSPVTVNLGAKADAGADGLMSKEHYTKLEGIEAGAQANVNSFGSIQVGGNNITADSTSAAVQLESTTDALSLSVEGNKVKFGIANSEASTGGAGGSAGLMTALQAENLATVKAQSQFSTINGNTGTVTANAAQDTVSIIGGGVVSVAGADKTLTITVAEAQSAGHDTGAVGGLMSANDKAKLDKFVVVGDALTYDGKPIGSNLVANEW